MSTGEIKDFNHFLLWEQASRDAIMVKRIYIDMAGDVLAGLMLSQIIYWHLPNDEGRSRLRVFKDGYWWLAKSHTEWWDECRLTVDQARRAVKILQEKNLIVTALKQFNGAPTVHIRLDQEAFLIEVNRFGLQPKSIRVVAQNELPGNPNPFGLQPRSFKQTLPTDSTTDITTATAGHSCAKHKPGASVPDAAALSEEEEVILRLVQAGMNESDAVRYARSVPEECKKQLEYLPFKKDIESPGAWLRSAIEGRFGAPKGYAAAKAKTRPIRAAAPERPTEPIRVPKPSDGPFGSVWDTALALLADRVNKPTLETHFRPARIASVSETDVTLTMSSAFSRNYVDGHHLAVLREVLTEIFQKTVEIRLTVVTK
jgi:hypothetical protein